MEYNKIDFEGLSRYLLNRVREILPIVLPGGHIVGHEYYCSDLSGGPGRSCKINIQTGRWADFASDVKGGDLISLIASIEGISQGEAARALAKQYNYTPCVNPIIVNEAPLPPLTPPKDAPVPKMEHGLYGLPVMSWVYRDPTDKIMFYIARYSTPHGKEFLPWTWNSAKWICKAWLAPRPLYGLEILVKAAIDAPILIVEGEKAADAARRMIKKYVVMTWPGGAKAVSKADWSPLHGRKILIWPDADAPGTQAAIEIATILKPYCPEIKILEINASEVGAGFDAADAFDKGWDTKRFYEWAKPKAQLFNLTINNNTQLNLTLNNEDDDAPSESMYAIWDRLSLARSSTGQLICNEDNVIRIFEGEPSLENMFWFDDFYNSVFFNDSIAGPREMKELDIFKLLLHLQRFYGMRRITDPIVRRAILILADRIHKNDVKDWLNKQSWDNTPRIDDFFHTHLGSEKNIYTCSASKNFWISMVARVYEPGCIMRSMTILKSKQMSGKSTAFSLIGGKWYCEALENIQSNNFLQSLHGHLLVEFGDLAGMDRAEVNRIKQIISCRKDRFRAPYDRLPTDHLRQCVLVGTTNESKFLRDDTGGTRFWPIETGKIDLSAISRDRNQLFAEAVARYKNKEDWYIMPEQETLEQQEKFRQSDEWEELIRDFIAVRNLTETTLGDLAQQCLHISIDKLDRSTQMRIAKNLTTLQWECRVVKKDGKAIRQWCRKYATTLNDALPDGCNP